ncbi:hypothetical protein FF011L_30970 [Roseimaritima multifibrata]|uniref:UPF0246 protein FF011L_30970 n=1 Tax=Roseimaritima multifibrata TaxID=1930274 RepID=A0A517MHF9_9BACT|nr:peroxide stress protein YaaA [Roseimaritima multifibrata]QDS94318.1 hypothetical protein FF011L_30970 [Roseimaritima multifibrata]
MLIVLSPAKTLDFATNVSPPLTSTPELLSEAALLAAELKKVSANRLGSLMKISDKLATLNHQRYQDWDAASLQQPGDPEAKPAVLAFQGDVYQGLEAGKWTEKQMLYAQDHLRILSGLYGILRPLDRMLPYRLEMGTKLKNRRGADLYAFWGTELTAVVNRATESIGSNVLLNLASQEYFRSLQPAGLSSKVISPTFKDLKNGKYKLISFYAKVARGMMADWVVRNRVKSLRKLTQFSEAGYRYDPESSTEQVPVFLRDQPV